jgi:hypothetical protein
LQGKIKHTPCDHSQNRTVQTSKWTDLVFEHAG